MPLKLVTGPANSGKAGVVLDAYRARLREEPILVVPSLEDVEHTQRELAEGGAVFGAQVLRFDWLFREIARRAGHHERPASDLQRELIVEEAVRSLELSALASSARRPGFVRAAARLVAELERSMVEPPRFTRALRDWAGDGPRRAYADEVAAVYAGYRRRLEEAGLSDPELYAWRALDALRRDARAWGSTPVFVYGFDDFTPLELRRARDAVADRGGGGDGLVALRARPHGLQGGGQRVRAALGAGLGAAARAAGGGRALRAEVARRCSTTSSATCSPTPRGGARRARR